MSIPTRAQCYGLFRKYKTPENVIRHSEMVARVAVFVAGKLKEAGAGINVKAVEAAALLHDIARLEKNHSEAAARIISKEGYPEIAEIARKHSYNAINELNSWEEKVVFYADKRAEYEIVSVRERIAGWVRKYPEHEKKIMQNVSAIKKLENEIFSKLKITPEDIK
jgi:putative nucleotidyltransferase with HDIG domain